MGKFNVGDIVVGNADASSQYSQTRTGVMCRVIHVWSDDRTGKDLIEVETATGKGPFTVNSAYFEHMNDSTPDEDGDFESFICAYG